MEVGRRALAWLGTLRATTDGAGAFAGAMAYTAFGEMVAADGTIGGEGLSSSPVGSRYQYAGDSGYESGLLPPGGSGTSIPGLPWQHVGHRWYDPSTGRFLQRDPIGVGGGLNVYDYADGSPADAVDPRGTVPDWHLVCVACGGHNGPGHRCAAVDPTNGPEDEFAQMFLCATGGPGPNFWDRLGAYVGANTLDAKITAAVAAAGTRVPKAGHGVASTKSIFEMRKVRHAMRITIRTGMRIGRVSGCVTVCEGCYNGYVVIKGVIVCW